MIRVTVWSEFRQARDNEIVKAVYPNDINAAIQEFLDQNEDMEVRLAYLDDPESGLSEETLEKTDVLIWWAHVAHNEVPDEIAERVRQHVLRGMGIIFLHSAHMCKPFLKLIGTSGTLKYREGDTERERLWVVNPAHPIAQGVGEQIYLEHEEMYGEPFDIPQPDELVFVGWFSSGYVFRSGCCWTRGRGRVFYFQPGHEEYPIYRNPEIQKIITNAVHWASPAEQCEKLKCYWVESLE